MVFIGKFDSVNSFLAYSIRIFIYVTNIEIEIVIAEKIKNIIEPAFKNTTPPIDFPGSSISGSLSILYHFFAIAITVSTIPETNKTSERAL